MTELRPPEHKMIYLELQHAIETIQRTALLAKGAAIQDDLIRLLENARDTLALIPKPPTP